MATPGLSPTGLVIDTIDTIMAAITADVQDRWGQSIDNSSATPNGQFSGIVAERLASVWQGLESVYSAWDPDKATGQGLDAICKITGTFRTPATSSTVTETLAGDPSTVVAAGFTVATSSTEEPFVSQVDISLDALDDWATSTSYDLDDRVTANARCYQCITAGESDSTGSGPSTTDADITDNDAHWTYIGDGTAVGDVVCASQDTGPIVGTARDITDIQTPLGGVNTAINIDDAELGSLEMSDQNLRLLREEELAKPGSTTQDAIRALLLEISGVTSVTVYMNVDDVTDDNSVPPHAVMALVVGGADQDTGNALWQLGVAAGIKTSGGTSVSVVDSEGNTQTVKFSRVTGVPISIIITLTKDPDTYIGDANVKTLIATWGNANGIGFDAVSSAIGAQAFGDPGVREVVTTYIALYPATPVSSTKISIDFLHQATYDTVNITVNSSDFTP
jgi:uncharacterized phage protein gp47/JayE